MKVAIYIRVSTDRTGQQGLFITSAGKNPALYL